MTAIVSLIFTAVLITVTAILKKRIERELSVLELDEE